MYQSSEEAIEANEAITFEAARKELNRHGFAACRASDDQHIMAIEMPQGLGCGPEGEAHKVALTTKAILEWLGY